MPRCQGNSNALTNRSATLKGVVIENSKPYPTPVPATFAFNQLINLLYLSGKMAFQSIEEHFPIENTEKKLSSIYPTALLANHVSEADILALAAVYRRLSSQIKMTIPAREDILRNDFLTTEFRKKGLLKLLFSIIDKSNLIPTLLHFIGCVPITRPFRDNSRELVRKGELREAVDAEWSSLVNTIEGGKNLFMFPEGTFNQDGYLNQIKKGVFYLKSKVTDMHFNSFNFTYDYLSFKKSKLHISYGTPFSILKEESSEAVAKTIIEKFGSGYTITLGNLLSYLLLKFDESSLVSIDRLFDRLTSLRDMILKSHTELHVGTELKKLADLKSISPILEKLKTLRFIDITDRNVRILSKLTSIPKSLHQLKKQNLVLYHKNQLTYHLAKLDRIYLLTESSSQTVH